MWKDVEVKSSFVEHLEHYMIKVRHRVSTASGASYENRHLPGFFIIDQQPHLMLCTNSTASRRALACSQQIQQWIGMYPPCSSSSASSFGACVSHGTADFISVQRLLDAAGIDLDEPLSGGISRRWWGTLLKLTIDYSNALPKNTWHTWPPQLFRPAYTYTVSKLEDFSWQSTITSTGLNSRTLTREAGIHLRTEVIGSMAEANALFAARRLASFAVIYELAALVFIRVAMLVYSQLRHYRHAHDMYVLSRYEHTADEEDARNVGNGRDMLRLNQIRNERRASAMVRARDMVMVGGENDNLHLRKASGYSSH